MATGSSAGVQRSGDAAAARQRRECGGVARPPPPTARRPRRAPETAAMSAPPPATPGWRRWNPASCRGFQAMERNQSGLHRDQRAVRDRQDARPAARAQERGPLFRRAGRLPTAVAAAVLGRHRRRQPRQRQHLHDGRRRPARRERAAEGPRHGDRRPAAPATAAIRRSGGGGCVHEEDSRSQRGRAAQDPHDAAQAAGARDRRSVLFNNTNNLKPAFERVDSDLHNYYMLGYTPINKTFDGKFRTIQVKVKRSGLTIAARKGISPSATPARLRQRLGSARARRARAEAGAERLSRCAPARCSFPNATGRGSCPSSSKSRPRRSRSSRTRTARPTRPTSPCSSASSIATIRSCARSASTTRSAASSRRSSAPSRVRSSSIASPSCRAGVYSMETVVHDAPSGKSSVRFATVEVPRYDDDTLRMSSLVSSSAAKTCRRRIGAPTIRCWSTASRCRRISAMPVSKASKEAGVLLRDLSRRRRDAGPTSTIELLQNGKPVAQLPMPVPPADASGRIQQLGRLPLDQLAPGTYELRAIVKQGDQQVDPLDDAPDRGLTLAARHWRA